MPCYLASLPSRLKKTCELELCPGILRFYNLRVSSRGQTRKGPSAAVWVCSLLELARHGERDTGSVLNSWNATASKVDRVAGGKYQAVKNLLDLPATVRNLVMSPINKYGFEGSLLKQVQLCHRVALWTPSFLSLNIHPKARLIQKMLCQAGSSQSTSTSKPPKLPREARGQLPTARSPRRCWSSGLT